MYEKAVGEGPPGSLLARKVVSCDCLGIFIPAIFKNMGQLCHDYSFYRQDVVLDIEVNAWARQLSSHGRHKDAGIIVCTWRLPAHSSVNSSSVEQFFVNRGKKQR